MRFAHFKDFEGNNVDINMDKVLFIRHSLDDTAHHFYFSETNSITILCHLSDLVVEITRP